MHTLSQRDPPIPTLYVKSTGRNADSDDIRSIFKKARNNAPCLLVLEDIDSLVKDNIKSFFLNEIDGLEGNDGIMIIGSTNYRKPTFLLWITCLGLKCCPHKIIRSPEGIENEQLATRAGTNVDCKTSSALHSDLYFTRTGNINLAKYLSQFGTNLCLRVAVIINRTSYIIG